jgi:hypothetical protein
LELPDELFSKRFFLDKVPFRFLPWNACFWLSNGPELQIPSVLAPCLMLLDHEGLIPVPPGKLHDEWILLTFLSAITVYWKSPLCAPFRNFLTRHTDTE